jgi:hypothetical protein
MNSINPDNTEDATLDTTVINLGISESHLMSMMTFASRLSTLEACEALAILDANALTLDHAGRLLRVILIDVLCTRHPEADYAVKKACHQADLKNKKTENCVAVDIVSVLLAEIPRHLCSNNAQDRPKATIS